MSSKKDALHTIGEVARGSGVSVKTIRHYSDIGVLPPSGKTGSGYRLYSEADRSRLEVIRTLRAAGFTLSNIKRLIEEKSSPSEALNLQLEIVEFQLRTLGRRRALLKSTLDSDLGVSDSYPDRARALGLLDVREREAFLGEQLERGLEGTPVDPDVKAWFWRQAVSGMPDELNEEQFEAWIELSELASDEDFIEKLREQTKPFWDSAEGHFDFAKWKETMDRTLNEAAAAVREDRRPSGEREQLVVGAWVEANARAMNRNGDPNFAGWWLSHHEQTSDPRMERYWRLISTLKQTEYSSLRAEAYQWLVDGLRCRVSKDREADSR